MKFNFNKKAENIVLNLIKFFKAILRYKKFLIKLKVI